MRWAPAILGPEREAEGYRWRSLLDAGARLAFGTDFPVEPIDPFRGLYASLTREFEVGGPEGGWVPTEKITIDQAMTVEAAIRARLSELLGGTVCRLVVRKCDLVNDTTVVDVRYRIDATGDRAVTVRHEALS